jgi:tetratricopeptide (TPR) repeat protein
VAFKQAAAVMDQMEATRLAALTPHDRAVKLAARAKDYFNRGLLLEAERLFQEAEANDNSLAEAHLGLATVRERTGDQNAARKEANEALKLSPSAEAFMVLGRLDMAENHMDEASRDVGEALKIDPASAAAKELNWEIEARSGKKP